MTRRDFLKLASVATAGLALAGCGLSPRKTATPAGPVQLVYQDWRTEWFPPMAQRMLEQFHAQHPDIRVYYTPDPDNFEVQMLADMQAGTAADVFQGCCNHFPTWAQRGFTLDLRPFVKGTFEQENLLDWDGAQYLSFFTAEGLQFGVPKYHGALALYYNKDIFDRYGVAYPQSDWNHTDYLTAMKALTHDQDGDGNIDLWGSMIDISWDRLQVHANAWGGHFVDPNDPTRCAMGDAESVAALEWIRARMWDDRVLATPTDVQRLSTRDAFIAQRVAMVEDGSWALKDILEKSTFRIGVATVPQGPQSKVTLATTDGYGIYAGSRYPEAAWELVKFLSGREYGLAMAEASLLQPARLSLIEDWIRIVRSQFPKQAAEMDLAVFADGQRRHYSVTAEVFSRNMTEATRLAEAAWLKIFTLGQEKTGLLQDVARQITNAQRTSTTTRPGGPRPPQGME